MVCHGTKWEAGETLTVKSVCLDFYLRLGMINLNAVVLRTLVQRSLAASGVIVAMYLAAGAALAAPAAQSTPGGNASVATSSAAGSGTETSTSKTNPFKGDKEKAAAGKKIFIGYGCVGCHGQSGGGGMGPSLIGNNWHYGGTDADLFHSIHDGRPKGMPAWSSHLSDNQIWEVITFVRSISIAE